MPLSIGEISINPPVILAPMAGITDRPFRAVVARFGAGLVVSEMVATQEMLAAKPSVRAKAEIAAGAARTAVQIAGREPGPMAEAARRVAGEGAAIVDINMGCPAKKVTTGASGAALMREPERALALVEAVLAAVEVPVTVKMRLGWDESLRNAADLAAGAAALGVSAVTVHGRTRAQFYKGSADWSAIRDTVAAVPVPVIANGDIACPATARAALARSGAAGIMVGRGAQGRPWVLSQIAAALAGRPVPDRPRGEALAETVLAHAEAHLSFYGRETGLRAFRKHVDAYCRAIPAAAQLRGRLVREETAAGLMAGLREIGAIDEDSRQAA